MAQIQVKIIIFPMLDGTCHKRNMKTASLEMVVSWPSCSSKASIIIVTDPGRVLSSQLCKLFYVCDSGSTKTRESQLNSILVSDDSCVLFLCIIQGVLPRWLFSFYHKVITLLYTPGSLLHSIQGLWTYSVYLMEEKRSWSGPALAPMEIAGIETLSLSLARNIR